MPYCPSAYLKPPLKARTKPLTSAPGIFPGPPTPLGPPGSEVPATMCSARKRVSNWSKVTIAYGRAGSGRRKVFATNGGRLLVDGGKPSVTQTPSPGRAGEIRGLSGTSGIIVWLPPLDEGLCTLDAAHGGLT